MRASRTQRAGNDRIFSSFRKGPESILVQSSTDGLPDRSWWLNLSRDELSKRAKAEQDRMQRAKFSRTPQVLLSE
jgi:hypothetical protein